MRSVTKSVVGSLYGIAVGQGRVPDSDQSGWRSFTARACVHQSNDHRGRHAGGGERLYPPMSCMRVFVRQPSPTTAAHFGYDRYVSEFAVPNRVGTYGVQ
jgi:hypothetical protein